MRHFPDTFCLFPEGQQLVTDLIDQCVEFAHLTRAQLVCLLSQRALVERGRAMPAVVVPPDSDAHSSAKRTLCDWLIAQFVAPQLDGQDPDFLVLFDTALWPKTATEREHVVYHALCHLAQVEDEYGSPRSHRDGRPLLRLRGHDIERFLPEIARYGSHIAGIADEHGVYAALRSREHTRLLKLA